MSNLEKIQEQTSAGPIAIAFDYQFYCFIVAALEMKTGDKVGFEVKDDIHIEKANGKIILQQLKHTVSKDSKGNPSNLTTLDSDLWKTLSRWADMIKAQQSILDNHAFCLVTNKGEKNNEFIAALDLFKSDGKSSDVIEKIEKLKNATTDKELKVYIKNFLSLGKKRITSFLTNLIIETNNDNIIRRIKQMLKERHYNDTIVDLIYNSLYSNISADKYLEIKEGNKFEISLSDFSKRYGKCFQQGWDKQKLPKREIQITPPTNLTEQIFIKQLIDIGELDANSKEIISFTAQMLEATNRLQNWIDNYDILTTDLNMFKEDSHLQWENEFKSKYRSIKNKINTGDTVTNLESEIKALALDLLDHMRKQTVSIDNENLGTKFSNGYYYSLSNEPKIGWHFDWENKYKTA
ncbi:hypothetical protein FW778_01995 [Ginsengibacter hankyongi]|uniref:ABC-three component systems C-terminal domain-containing protein n=1 Tax=Ginsengibacter hankyongi TaxID=2607284 RepID=A0A5J5IIS2_9BACT|nr:ABC-three component system protein [Ginsengibacter hankyongi]KAA9040836.1 hypothetical protein FW778_01995 [Ginsengibacter hankyongi]